MDILFLADNFPPETNAQASRVYERACYWVRWGHKVTVITCAPNFPEGRLHPGYTNGWRQAGRMDGIRVVRVKTFIAPNAGTLPRILDFLSYMVMAVLAGLFEARPGAVVATSPQFFAGVAGWTLAALRRVPFVLEISDLWPESIVAVGAMRGSFGLRMLEKLELFLYGRASRIVALTAAFKKNLMRRGVPAEKIHVVLNGVELEMYSPRPRDGDLAREWGIGEQHFVAGYVGTLGMAHGLENVLRAASLVDDPDVRFVFIGAGAERRRLITEARRLGLRNVIFIPALPKARMPAAWSICDAALVHLKNTPLFETVIPSKMFEAMAMQLPILLAAPEGEASRILEAEQAGIAVAPGNPAQLAAAVLLLKENAALRRRLASAGRAAAHRYSRERQAGDMLSALEMSQTRQRVMVA